MEIYILKSDHSEVPMAEIRVQGNQMEVVTDNTEDHLTKRYGSNFQALKQMVDESSHLQLVPPQEPSTQLLRYVLSNGDVAEITTDGKTCVLNGRLLQESEKDVLFQSIRSGKLQVSRKADIANPVPILPPAKQVESKPVQSGFNLAAAQPAIDALKKKDRAESMSDRKWDNGIESRDYRGMNKSDQQWLKDMLYFLKYGDEE